MRCVVCDDGAGGAAPAVGARGVAAAAVALRPRVAAAALEDDVVVLLLLGVFGRRLRPAAPSHLQGTGQHHGADPARQGSAQPSGAGGSPDAPLRSRPRALAPPQRSRADSPSRRRPSRVPAHRRRPPQHVPPHGRARAAARGGAARD